MEYQELFSFNQHILLAPSTETVFFFFKTLVYLDICKADTLKTESTGKKRKTSIVVALARDHALKLSVWSMGGFTLNISIHFSM